MLFPTDLTSFLDVIRQHGNAAYSFLFVYAAGHSLLLTLFAGYAVHSGALDYFTLIMVCWAGTFTGDVFRFWIGRRFGTRWLTSFPKLERFVQTAAGLADRHYAWMMLFHRFPNGIRGVAGCCVWDVAAALVDFPGVQFRGGGALVLRGRLGRLCLRPGLGEGLERCFLRRWPSRCWSCSSASPGS